MIVMQPTNSSSSSSSSSSAGTTPVVVPPADLDAEWASLEAVDCAGDSDAGVSHEVPRVSEAVGAAYAEVRRHARRLNLVTARPEVVLVGTAGAGKSALLDAVVGVSGVGSAQPTQRPLVVHTAWAREARAVFRRDLSLREYDRDEVLAGGFAGIAGAVAARNVAAAATEAMVLQLESPRMLDATYIDTPGLIADAKHPLAAAHEAATLGAIAPAHRLIVVVRPAACAALPRASHDYVLDVVRRVDPEYTRTVVVYTQLHTQLQAFQSAKAVNQYLTVTAPDVRTYFVTLPALELRDRIGTDPAAYDAALRRAARRDRLALEQLQYDKRHEGAVGAPAFVQHITQYVRRAHQAFSPRVLQEIRARRAAAEHARTAAEHRADTLTPTHFRAAASECATLFLQTVHALLRGTADANPALNGETLDQEKDACGIDGQWVTANGEPLPLRDNDGDNDGDGDSVPLWDNRLYGTQQFERLLAEFRLVGEHLRIPTVSDDDIATAAGIPALANTPNTLWAASDIARQKSQDTFVPLVAQLAKRAEHVLCRLADIAETLMEERARRTDDDELNSDADDYEDNNSSSVSSRISGSTYFVNFVKDRYVAFVEDASARCQEACMHEFFSSRTIYWDLTANNSGNSAPAAPSSTSEVRDLAARLFDTLKQRIVSNVIVKFYQFLLVPLDAPLWAAMQKQVSELADDTLEQLFTADTLRHNCADKAAALEATAAELAEEETAFVKVAHNFAHLE